MTYQGGALNDQQVTTSRDLSWRELPPEIRRRYAMIDFHNARTEGGAIVVTTRNRFEETTTWYTQTADGWVYTIALTEENRSR